MANLFFRFVRYQAGINNLQIIIFGKIEYEMICQRLNIPDFLVNDDRAYAIQEYRPDIRGILQMRMTAAIRAET